MRLDELLVERGLFSTAHDAQAAVMAGEVVVGEHRADSAGMNVREDAPVRVKADKCKGGYVSRGGIKLERALDEFGISVRGLDCVDIGASSGGFTDCLLRRGAAHVSAVDVGAGQFDWGLRNDARVSLYERTNIRNVRAADIGGPFDLAVADLSFISLRTVMDDVAGLLEEGGVFVSLVKPQFEARREEIDAGGVVRSASVHASCIAGVLDAAMRSGFDVRGLAHSPVTGPAGNIEFLLWAEYRGQDGAVRSSMVEAEIEGVVAAAHAELGGDT